MSERRQVWQTLTSLIGRLEQDIAQLGLGGNNGRFPHTPTSATPTLDTLEKEVRKLGKTQLKANTLAENQQSHAAQLIASLQQSQAATEAARDAPRSASGSSRLRVRLCTVTSKPALSRLPAIGPPIAPRPMNATDGRLTPGPVTLDRLLQTKRRLHHVRAGTGHAAAHVRPYGKHLLIQMHRDDGVDTVARLTEVARNQYTAAFRSHTGRWEPLPAPPASMKQTVELVTTLLASYLEP